MYRRTGSASMAAVSGTAPGTIVLSICGGSSSDIVARPAWSASTSAQKPSSSRSPYTPRSCRTFFTQCARCHWALRHSASVTSAKPGSRRQSGSTSSRAVYSYGCSSTVDLLAVDFSPARATLREVLRWNRPDTIGSPVPTGEEGRRVDPTAARALGLHRVLEPAGALPQAALRLDPDPAIGPDEVRIAVERLNLDAASFRQLSEACDGDRS